MKKWSLICFFILFSLGCMAQDKREIRMPEQPQEKTLVSDLSHQKQGYWCAAEFSAASTTMMSKHNSPYVGISFSNGYRFCEFLKVGVGIGCNWWVLNSQIRESDISLTMPVFVCARGNFLPDILTDMTPFWDVKAGTCVGDREFVSSSVGLRFGDSRSAFTLSVGYTYRKVEISSDILRTMHCAELHLGYEF